MFSDDSDASPYDVRIPDGTTKLMSDFSSVIKHVLIQRGQKYPPHPREDIVKEHMASMARNDVSAMDSTCLFLEPNPPRSTPFSSLRPIFIKDLTCFYEHHEEALILRSLVPPRRYGDALQTVVEDQNGSCAYLRYYCPVVGENLDDWLPKGSVFAVKSPWYESTSIQESAIVVNYVGNLFRLGQGGVMYPTQWNQSVPPSATSASEWFKEEGNKCYKEKSYRTAVLRYTEALNFEPNEESKIAIYSNRAQAHLATGAFEATIADADFVLSAKPQHEKALFRCARAHYALANYAKAIELLESIIQSHPSNQPAREDLQRAKQRIVEQTTGAYDFAHIREAASRPFPCIDVASFVGPVRQGDPVEQSPGLFATRDIKAGELLFCTKAFEFQYANNDDYGGFINSRSTWFGSAAALRLSRRIAQKFLSNPSCIAHFMQLHRFSPQIVGSISDNLVDGQPVVDDYLIESILNVQIYSSNKNRGTTHKYNCVGVYITPSYLGHHCLGNCTRIVIGDLEFVRASRDIAVGDEIRFPYFPSSWPVAKRQESLKEMYNITCTCRLCQCQLAETQDNRRERDTVDRRDVFDMRDIVLPPGGGGNRRELDRFAAELEKICADMETTYLDPPSVHPRFLYIEKLFRLAFCYDQARNMEKHLETSLRALSVLGFEASVDASGILQIVRHGHYDRTFVSKIAALQATAYWGRGLKGPARSWMRFAAKAFDIDSGHRALVEGLELPYWTDVN